MNGNLDFVEFSPPWSETIDDLIVSASLVPPRDPKSAGITHIDFDGLLTPPLQLKEDLKEGCGGQLWPAGMLLASYMLRNHSSDLRGKTIVELGAGGGVVGLAVAKGCSIDSLIYLTDQMPMLALMEENVRLNGLAHIVQPLVLDWGEPLPPQIPSFPDIILAADCVYFEPAFPLLLSTLTDLLGPASLCYFCFKKRRRADLRFMKQAKKLFDVTEITNDKETDTHRRESIFLYRIRKRYNKNI
ncbi:hypothetical protein AJ80_04596 [Polytolypa hystricis UAMH7299]|uniref:Protein-lysine N-methyltransferase EFM6 n=1 Tax=Polytolypa hystricis (strain UAMH7299) TaxID=1447883 RepID=A0A2B7Y9Q0_POLH7|nr:hypothetical protein AJ80_04596 [Polytolypa hystricis UAMH7299]